MNASSQRLILASGSPRRAALMREHGFRVEIVLPAFPEPAVLGSDREPAAWAESLSRGKAQSVAERLDDGWILSGDTIVTLEDRVFGKPVGESDARRILSTLAGTTHQVITGVTLLDARSERVRTEHDTTAVTMRSLSRQEVDAYVDTGAWKGKAGAYGIQDRGDAFIERIDGSFTNVVGFPMELVTKMLDDWGYRS